MKVSKLTKLARPAHSSRMRGQRKSIAGAVAVMGSALVGGCITVKAPDDKIVIELNINISQEVVYRLAGDVQENIEQNPEIF